jgi:hypothetical protein
VEDGPVFMTASRRQRITAVCGAGIVLSCAQLVRHHDARQSMLANSGSEYVGASSCVASHATRWWCTLLFLSVVLTAALALTGACSGDSLPPAGTTVPTSPTAIDWATDCTGVTRTSDFSCEKTTAPSVVVPDTACPPRALVEEIRREMPVVVKNEKDARLVCHASAGSLDMTFNEALVVKHLAIIRRLRFDRPLPWTNKSLYEWLRDTIPAGIAVDTTGSSYSCLRCPGPVHLHLAENFPNLEHAGFLEIVHEARHAEGWPHTCARDTNNQLIRDKSVGEMGAFGVQVLLSYWIANYSDESPEFRALHRGKLGIAGLCCECPGSVSSVGSNAMPLLHRPGDFSTLSTLAAVPEQ